MMWCLPNLFPILPFKKTSTLSIEEAMKQDTEAIQSDVDAVLGYSSGTQFGFEPVTVDNSGDPNWVHPSVELICDQTNLALPEGIDVLAAERCGQLKSTVLDQLCEVAGRTCYDSFGKGRTSEDYHSHLRDIKHGSVHEHAHVVIHVGDYTAAALWAVNRPGVVVSPDGAGGAFVDANLRAVYESKTSTAIDAALNAKARSTAPLVMGTQGSNGVTSNTLHSLGLKNPNHAWLTFFISCSRGCTHELVRHRHNTAFSQRSTRYVDESESPWVIHPNLGTSSEVLDTRVITVARRAYKNAVQELESSGHSRKQARGAARGYLGNALLTELVMTANVTQWCNIIKQRNCEAADAEIRFVAQAIETLIAKSDYAKFLNP